MFNIPKNSASDTRHLTPDTTNSQEPPMEPTTDPAPKLLTHNPNSSTPLATPGRGRRRILNDAKCKEVCSLVAAGCGIEDAARHIGRVPRTIDRPARRNPDFGKALHQ